MALVLCAAVIFKGKDFIRGLSTAATIWTTASIGTAWSVGYLALQLWELLLFQYFTYFHLKAHVKSAEHE